MATTHWICDLTTCGHIGTVDEFKDSGYNCPKCGNVDVLPYRIFRCENCGETGELHFLTQERVDSDPDPIEEGQDWHRCGKCGSGKIVQVDHEDHSKILGRLPVADDDEERSSSDDATPANPSLLWQQRRDALAQEYLALMRDGKLTRQQIIELCTAILKRLQAEIS